ncbi:MAG: hypothetical protein ACK5GJ_12370, partial [Planctomycetota bacterium]
MLDLRIRIAVVLVLCCLVRNAATAQEKSTEVQDLDRQWVGGSIEDSIVTPVNQRLTPVGKWLDLPGMRPQVLALSPDGK